jgi:hypothetical protein
MGSVTHTSINSYSFTTTLAQTIDTFPIATYRSAEYLIQIANSTQYQVSKILAIHDGTTSYVTEYGIMTTGVSMGVFSTSISAGSLLLQCTPVSNTGTAKIHRIAVTV